MQLIYVLLIVWYARDVFVIMGFCYRAQHSSSNSGIPIKIQNRQ